MLGSNLIMKITLINFFFFAEFVNRNVSASNRVIIPRIIYPKDKEEDCN